MKVLFIGGTGTISTACTAEALRQGIRVVHLNRGSSPAPAGVRTIQADFRDFGAVKNALSGERFDCVVDWIAYTPQQVERDIELFGKATAQYIFISSASVYQRPPSDYRITESTPAHNPFWEYSQKKIACERALMHACETSGFPVTIVRPSHTYDARKIPTTFGSSDFTVPKRMLDGKRIVVHGDGQSLWTITHADDFAVAFTGLLGHDRAIGETFHITSDEALTWDQIHRMIARALGVEARIVHIASEKIARLAPSFGPGLLGDKMHSVVFDNTKIKRFVPGYEAKIPFHRGIARSVETALADAALRKINAETDAIIDSLLEAYG
jgi:nucleoside-diphosphate-sugar epimerase